MNIRRKLSLAAALALATGTAYAADVPNFNQMDKDNDGSLTRSEAAGNPKLADQFSQVDDDGDGRLSRGEYLAIMGRQDFYNLRENLAEFINPDGKAPLDATSQSSGQASSGQSAQQSSASTGGQQQQGPQAPSMAASEQLIRNVQQQLQAKGVDAGPVDGIWGPQTHQGVREFQQAQGLQSTGQLNGRTLAALGISQEQSASAGQSRSSEQSSASAGSSAPSFQRADRNNDGHVGRDEFEAAMGKAR